MVRTRLVFAWTVTYVLLHEGSTHDVEILISVNKMVNLPHQKKISVISD